MAYTKTLWEARQGTGLNRFLKTQETSVEVNLVNEPLAVTNPGTPFSEENMNHIERGIEDAHELIAAESQAREQSGNELAQAITDEAQARQEADEEAIREHDENEGAHADIRAAISAEKQTRQAADEGLQQNLNAVDLQLQENIQAEAHARQNADLTLQDGINNANGSLKGLEDSFNSWIGRGGYLEAYDFGTSAPAQEDLTDQALSQITSISDPLQVWNGTKIENLFDGHLWALTNTQDTDPPIFEWSDQGPASISPFAQDTGGYIVGADPNADGGGFIQAMPGGKGRVIGWEQIIASSSFLAAHPVGSIYLSVDSVNPGIQYGGTWEAWGQGKVPVGVDASDADFNEAEIFGGEKKHILNETEMPSHTHTQNSHTHTEASHTHTLVTGNSNIVSSAPNQQSAYSNIYNGKYSTPNYPSSNHSIPSSTPTINAATAVNQNKGGSAAHNNLQPYITCYMWKRTE